MDSVSVLIMADAAKVIHIIRTLCTLPGNVAISISGEISLLPHENGKNNEYYHLHYRYRYSTSKRSFN